MIISIRGTHGSGKSTTVKELIAMGNGQPIMGRLRNKPEAYRLILEGIPDPVFALGPYTLACGGCDAVQPYDIILDLIRDYATQGHVVFEGALVSSSFGRIGALLEQRGQEAVFAFLTTPPEECLRRIVQRRLDRGDLRPLNPANTLGKVRSIESSKKTIAAKGTVRMVDLDYKSPVDGLLDLLKGAQRDFPVLVG